MKHSFSILIMFAIITLFSALGIFMFEIKSLKSENIKNEYLQTQAQLHLEFLTDLVKTIEDASISTLLYNDNIFNLKIEVYTNRYELYVYATEQNVSLHRTIIK